MLNICDVSLDDFEDIVCRKKLFIIGAGIRAKRLVNECNIKQNLIAIVDNNINLQGDIFYKDKLREIKIITMDAFISQLADIEKSHVVLLISPVFEAHNIFNQLNSIEELDGIDCYFGELLCSFYLKHSIDYTQGELIIPKKIHYCWFGKQDLPDKQRKCIQSWYDKCPDYEIIRWDEKNYDITKNQYMNEAYKCKRWGFVPDYARLDIIYNEGGIYLDTDVELLDNLDKFLSDEMFCGFSGELCIAMGLTFGAIKNHRLVKALRDVYDDKCFCMANGKLDLRPCVEYQNPVFKSVGFNLRNRYQILNNVAIYPSEVFSPLGIVGGRNNFTEHTVSIHHGSLSWVLEKEVDNCRTLYKKISGNKEVQNARIFTDKIGITEND